jgi:hypothetical protein
MSLRGVSGHIGKKYRWGPARPANSNRAAGHRARVAQQAAIKLGHWIGHHTNVAGVGAERLPAWSTARTAEVNRPR